MFLVLNGGSLYWLKGSWRKQELTYVQSELKGKFFMFLAFFLHPSHAAFFFSRKGFIQWINVIKVLPSLSFKLFGAETKRNWKVLMFLNRFNPSIFSFVEKKISPFSFNLFIVLRNCFRNFQEALKVKDKRKVFVSSFCLGIIVSLVPQFKVTISNYFCENR